MNCREIDAKRNYVKGDYVKSIFYFMIWNMFGKCKMVMSWRGDNSGNGTVWLVF